MSFTAPLADVVAANRNGLLGLRRTWTRVPLREIAEVRNGFPFSSQLFTQAEGMPLIRIRDVVRGFADTRYTGDYEEGFVVKRGD
jgi:type I restriction enzyme S subunit